MVMNLNTHLQKVLISAAIAAAEEAVKVGIKVIRSRYC
jgi:hypothetical protein